MYTIEIKYQTGDSLGSTNKVSEVGYEWNDLDKAKEALKCIKEHHQYFKYMDSCRWNKDTDKYPTDYLEKQRWINNKGQYDRVGEYSIKVPSNGGDLTVISCFWMGYFEDLHSAKIVSVTPEESDMEFIPEF